MYRFCATKVLLFLMLAHEKLQVYAKALTFVAATSSLSAAWSRKHAVVDQLTRASESLILNLADAARYHTAPAKLRSIDYVLGSGLECAACLDVAGIKGLLGIQERDQEKERLSEIIRMSVGLKKAWETWRAHDNPVSYHAELLVWVPKTIFHHEQLEVYCVALELMAWLVSLPAYKALTNRLCRRTDEAATSVLLNIAEGNGRYSEVDHRRFLDFAEASAVKVAAYLDLAVQKDLLSSKVLGPGKVLLERIIAMLSRM